MADTLLLHYNPSIPDRATWSLTNSQGELTSRITNGSLQEAAALAANHRTVVLVDGRHVHLNHVKLPTSNRPKMLRAVPYALEEQIAEEIEDFHFVIGGSGDAGTAVAGIRSDTLDEALRRLEAADIRAEAMIPDALCLPSQEGQWTVLIHEDRALVRFENGASTVIDTDNLSLVLEAALLRTERRPEQVLLFSPDEAEPPALFSSADEAPEIMNMTYNTHPLVVFCGQYLSAMPLNLLQEAYKPRRRYAAQLLRWRLPAALAACWLVLYLGSTAFELNRLKQSNTELREQSKLIYRQTFPESTRVVNARVQMEQKLKELRSGGGGGEGSFLELLAESVDAISAQNDVVITSINYRNQRMNIGVSSSKLQSVESLNSQLNNNPRLKSELSSATAEKNEVKGSIRLQRKES